MTFRLRLLQGATVLLYFGPLLAGLGGFGWSVIPIFAVLFLLWLFILRPQQWPRHLADWARPEALIALLTQAVVQVLLVAVSFGIGRGIGGALGALPPFPLMLPVGISFLSIPLARMLWDPFGADEGAVGLDAVLSAVNDPEADLPTQIAQATRMVAALRQLPETTPDSVLLDHLAAMGQHVSPAALREALMTPIHDGSAGAVQRRAAVLQGADVAVAGAVSTAPSRGGQASL